MVFYPLILLLYKDPDPRSVKHYFQRSRIHKGQGSGSGSPSLDFQGVKQDDVNCDHLNPVQSSC